ncbi:protein FAR1-RELATED SEQUENCE 5-like [Rhododendron vialii]|uniref:protein FAR1-RELATED SEQUENCE 5-like n=1 Tax=Rhododendron vialii TaxID=182163 RepID=UPI00265FD41A|nr:protein FAR1-RELATED SEQUENCE 5-like [Rhododendron vialii]
MEIQDLSPDIDGDIKIISTMDCKDLVLEEDQNLDGVPEPKVGMTFNFEDDGRDYYARYAKVQGFGVVTRTSSKRNGQRTNITYCCHRGGKPRTKALNPLKAPPTSKTQCKASMNLSLQTDGKWLLNSIELKHNHELCPNRAWYLKSNRVIRPYAKRTIELNCSARRRMNKTINSCVIDARGHGKDSRNYTGNVGCLQLKEGDAEAMHKYFIKMKADNEAFFYAMDLDEENRLKNVFWADARSREVFKEFGDVVTFDTTYLVNKYDMPFAPFVGVNHHGQLILFGCGLISREDTASFVWLFETFVACMSGCSPNAIVTDQCRAMQNAISIVFPNARHRWCLWHLLKRVPEKLKGYNAYEWIKSGVLSAVYNSLTREEFEENWGNVINKYQLEGNEWLSGLYEERHRWVPAFVKDVFCAGMSATQQSESMNAYFDGYIHSNTTLKEFLEKYENALRKKVQKEEEEDTRCFNVRVKNVSPYGFENQFLDAYTFAKCKDFRDEVAGKIVCSLSSVKVVDDRISEYEIEEDMKYGEREILKTVTFHVRYNEESKESNCTCWLFESKGIVCKHIVVVWSRKKLNEVPEKYILRRWSKNVRRSYTRVKVSYANWECKPEWRRYDFMLDAFHKVADKAMDSEAKSGRVVAKLLEAEVENEVCEGNRPMSIDVLDGIISSEWMGRSD